MTRNALYIEMVGRSAVNSHIKSTPEVIVSLVSSNADTTRTTWTVLHGLPMGGR